MLHAPLTCACCKYAPGRFEGAVEGGLITHTDGRTLIYPLGSTIVLRDKQDPRAQEFLQGHSDKVGAMWPACCCPSGARLGRVASVLWHPTTCEMAYPPTCGCLSVQVSCLALSKSGRYLASGQITYMGFTADIIIWDLESRQLLHRMALHKVGATAGQRNSPGTFQHAV